MEIRLATLDDISAICLLYHEFWHYNAGLQPEYYQEATESGEYPRSVITEEKSAIFLAAENDEIVGLIHVRESQTLPYAPIVQHRYAEIVDFIVTAPYRTKGIGAKLMDAAKQWGKTRNLDYVELFVLSNAERAFLFYEQKGFATVSHTMRCPL